MLLGFQKSKPGLICLFYHWSAFWDFIVIFRKSTNQVSVSNEIKLMIR